MLVYRAGNKIQKINHNSKRVYSSELIIAYDAVTAELYAQPFNVPCYERYVEISLSHCFLKTLRGEILD